MELALEQGWGGGRQPGNPVPLADCVRTMVLKPIVAKRQFIFFSNLHLDFRATQIAINSLVSTDATVQKILNALSPFLRSHPRTALARAVREGGYELWGKAEEGERDEVAGLGREL